MTFNQNQVPPAVYQINKGSWIYSKYMNKWISDHDGIMNKTATLDISEETVILEFWFICTRCVGKQSIFFQSNYDVSLSCTSPWKMNLTDWWRII